MQIHLISISSTISEDNFEDGIGDETGCGLNNEKIGKSFPDMAAMIKHLADYHGLPSDPAGYEDEVVGKLRTSKPVADHSQAQNGGWMEPTEEEMSAWRDGKGKLFIEEYEINYLEF